MPVSKIGTNALASGLDVSSTNISYTGTLTGGTGVVNIGSGQFYKDASGNVGIGVTPSAWGTSNSVKAFQTPAGAVWNFGTTSLYFSQGFFFNGSNRIYSATGSGVAEYSQQADAHVWASAGSGTAGNTVSLTERARITSDGYFKASNTGSYRNSGVACPEFNQSANSDGLLVNVTNASYTNNALAVTATRNTTNNSFFAFSYYNDTAAAYRFRVADSGNATNTNGSYGAISDAKLKENVVDATPKLQKLTQVRIVNYNLIGETQKQIGVIAQELEPIFPGMVEETPDRDEEGNDLGTTTKSVKYSVFVPMLIKAIQELKAELDSVKAELAVLKGV